MKVTQSRLPPFLNLLFEKWFYYADITLTVGKNDVATNFGG
jgi:hypothetical protein